MPYGADPANNPRDVFRLYVGDTDPTSEIFTDSEIDYYIAEYGSVGNGALNSLYALKAKASHCVTESVGSTSKQYSNLIKQYDELISALQRKIDKDAFLSAGAPMYAGGISKADKHSRECNSDRVEPYFTRNTMDGKDVHIGSESEYGQGEGNSY